MDAIVDFFIGHADNFWWGLTVFVIFVLIILKAGVKPVVNALDEREAHIKSQIHEAEQTAENARSVQAKLDAELAGAEAKIAEMMNEARRDAEAHKTQVVADGRLEVETMRNKALREIEAARYQAVVAIRKEVAEVATTAAEKILREELDAAKHQDLVSAALDDYEANVGAGA